jgi:hypothetical protein
MGHSALPWFIRTARRGGWSRVGAVRRISARLNRWLQAEHSGIDGAVHFCSLDEICCMGSVARPDQWTSSGGNMRLTRRRRVTLRLAPVLPLLSGVLLHDRNISVGLVRYHLPTPRKASQNRGLGSALSQKHEAMTILGVRPAAACFVHFPLRIKIGQRRHSRYTRPKLTIESNRWRLRYATTLERRAGPVSWTWACSTPP